MQTGEIAGIVQFLLVGLSISPQTNSVNFKYQKRSTVSVTFVTRKFEGIGSLDYYSTMLSSKDLLCSTFLDVSVVGWAFISNSYKEPNCSIACNIDDRRRSSCGDVALFERLCRRGSTINGMPNDGGLNVFSPPARLSWVGDGDAFLTSFSSTSSINFMSLA
uniref:Uncharacterized protein n=1 Tax=Romanomermis culicivorax TaxID=13658 RepID=A0A915JN55_ROMCU